jgi:23S rRNA (guanosine2251-2'-O)-methyltransferase
VEAEEVVWGRNAVLEALRGQRPVRRVLIAHGVQERGALAEVLAEAKEQHLPLQRLPREALDRLCGTSHHQGVAALTTTFDYVEVEDILAEARARGEEPFVLVLDSVQDPQNLGSLMRTAEAAGAHGVVIPKHRAAGLTAAVAKASAGAIEHLKAAQVTNLARTLEELKEAGLWVAGVDMAGELAYDRADLAVPLALVVGSEGQGLHRLVREKCDFTVRLPMRGKVASLNAAVSGSIVLYEAMRQRQRGRLPG